jgi:very-short-patch-repair endonuclease
MAPEDNGVSALRGPKPCGHPLDLAIGRLAESQHGVVSRAQLVAAGATEKAIAVRIRSGRLVRLHRGVYAVGHRQLRRQGWWRAAVLAVGSDAVLSHRDAAALHGIRPPTDRVRVDVTTPDRSSRTGRPGIDLHRSLLHRADVILVDGIPATTVSRTLVDLAAILTLDQLTYALGEAERRHLLDVDAIEAARRRLLGRRGPGHGRLERALAEHRALGAQLTRSELERRFAELVARAGLPRPRLNATVHGVEVDASWPDQALVVELDGYAFHRGRAAFQRDRTKGNDLTVAGFAVLRFTHHDVVRRPEIVASRLAAALARRRPTGR